MANKKYSDFNAGTPESTDISLFGDPTTGSLEKATLSTIGVAAQPYLEYAATISQTGTNDPVATVQYNQLGGTVVWSRAGSADFRATLVGAFPAGKLVQITTFAFDAQTSEPLLLTVARISDDELTLVPTDIGGGTFGDGSLDNASVVIRVAK